MENDNQEDTVIFTVVKERSRSAGMTFQHKFGCGIEDQEEEDYVDGYFGR